ncbi:MAG: hypothetical protein HYY37_04295 [Candidatus Aenigmarchaeota archaeon]|nr:hypothetical protein [Candidatus Aenigmarchaeota archaeon]
MEHLTATVREVIHETSTTFLVRLALPEPLVFKPGQYVMVQIDDEHVKPYSIASPPSEKAYIEFCIRRVEGGYVSSYMYNLKPNQRLKLMGPVGSFVLREVTTDIVFLATGTGISSLKGMIDTIFERGTEKEIWLFFGNRTEDEIIYREHFEELAKQHKNFHFIPCLSRASDIWKGERGYAQDVMKKHLANPKEKDVYICGVAAMVEQAAGVCKAMGFRNVYFEKYV